MSEPKRILVLHDSLDFGGHERAFLTWLPAVLQSPEVEIVTLACPAANTAFAQALAPFLGPKLELFASPFAKQRAEPFRAPFRSRYRRWVRALAASTRPDIVLLLQGRIENLATPMTALPRGAELVSYVPMAHTGREMGRWPPAAWLSDGVKRLYYARPDRFIVPSSAVADQLRRAGARGEVHVVRNVPELQRRMQGRSPSGRPSALFLGRFETRQKGLDLLLDSMQLASDELRDFDFLFVGQGPDADWLRARLDALPGVSSRVTTWTDDPGRVLSECDAVLMPSRFEGVPLVLLEALASRTPVLASPIDVFREHLPSPNLFAFGGPGLGDALKAATSSAGRQRFAAHARTLDPTMDLQLSSDRFVAAVLGAPTLDALIQRGAA